MTTESVKIVKGQDGEDIHGVLIKKSKIDLTHVSNYGLIKQALEAYRKIIEIRKEELDKILDNLHVDDPHRHPAVMDKLQCKTILGQIEDQLNKIEEIRNVVDSHDKAMGSISGDFIHSEIFMDIRTYELDQDYYIELDREREAEAERRFREQHPEEYKESEVA